MEAKNSIPVIEKVYLSNYHINGGNFKISDGTLETSLKSLAQQYHINYKNIIYSMENTLIEHMTFINCYNEEHDVFYWYLPKNNYTLSFLPGNLKYVANSIVDNANILVTINGYDVTNLDSNFMRYWFILVARRWAYRKTIYGDTVISYDMTINTLLEACCDIWWKKFQAGTLVEDMKKKSIKNCGCKTITRGGNLTAKEKNSISHMKLSVDKRSEVIRLRFEEGKSYGDISKLTGIIRPTVQKICFAYEKKQITPGSIQQNGDSQGILPGSIQLDFYEKETVPTLNSIEYNSLEQGGPGSIQQPATLQANQAVGNENIFNDDDLREYFNSIEI
jgi:hypothetical protein